MLMSNINKCVFKVVWKSTGSVSVQICYWPACAIRSIRCVWSFIVTKLVHFLKMNCIFWVLTMFRI